MPLPESGQLVLTLLNTLIDTVKSPEPLKTDGSSLTLGMVYSQLPLGMMVDPQDYANPWSPDAGATVADSSHPAASPAGSHTPLDAAFKTAQLVDRMLMVTKDNSYLEYRTVRTISLNYQNIINAMQPIPAPPLPANIQSQIDAAAKVLYQHDAQGNVIGDTPLYARYKANATAYAKAKQAYNDAKTKALADPVTANAWPEDSVTYQDAVDQAFNDLNSQGAPQAESALAITTSQGVSIQSQMVVNARKVFQGWDLGLAGVAVQTPYSYLSPTNWSDPDDNSEGWTRLQISQSDYQSVSDTSSSQWSAGGSAFFGFLDSVGGSASGGSSSSNFANDSSGLSVDLEYGVVTINRPWLIGDLFYLTNWYLVGSLKDAISNGTLDGQDISLLPMIQVQFLCVRNFRISANKWNSDGNAIASRFSGGGGFSIGFMSFGSDYSTSHTHSSYGWSFDGATLSMHGVQIVAWLSEIVPACAPLDDPGLPH
jgi:hypothetical protein